MARSTREVADRLASLCRDGKWVEAIEELYAEDVRQVENDGQPTLGRATVARACQGWLDSRELHGAEVLAVHVADDSFVVEYRYDETPQTTGQRQQWSEAAVYGVRDGVITDARFYYKPAPG